ncbi:MAG: hypothetical protein N5P05_000176 [Chroococcopsis gigantea SAG 12.99]|jgi:O-antigen/teichoic acid export membrane protein|nr:oligosaccharide flippase family protein [Chlorogloea purpurea SAG 13.99]MDV2998570.1 hypothetical protein [Chroococcopsis gigantea SAG 12.99]
MSSLKKLAIRGSIWTIFSYGATQLLRLASNLILTRLLVPELFGMMALVSTFITGLQMFSEIGVGPNIIRNPRGNEPDFYNTAWTIQVIRGFCLWLCSLLISWPLAIFYHQPQFLWLIPIVGFSTVIAGFNSTGLSALNRKMALGKLTLFELGIQVTSLTVMLILAKLKPTIWALVIGNLVSAILKMIISHRLLPEIKNRFAWEAEAKKDLISFGRWIFVSTAMLFLASQSDRLILGRLLSLPTLGVYTVALTFADLPRQIGAALSFKVVFPVVSRYVNEGSEVLRLKILPKRKQIVIGLGFLLSLLACFGDFLITKLYSYQYHDAAWMLPILALGIWPTILFQMSNPLLIAIGKPVYGAAAQSAKLFYMVVFLPLAFHKMGVFGAIIAIALNDIPSYLAVAYGMEREKSTIIYDDLQITVLLITFIIIVLAVRFYVGLGLPIDSLGNLRGSKAL